MSKNLLTVETIGQSDGELHRVAERPNYLRDSETKALFIFDEHAIAEHEERKQKRQKELDYQNKVDNLEKDLGDIKRMLSVLINKVDNK